MGTVRISERVAAPFSGAKVDESAGVIAGASICGSTSLNGNDYAPASFGDGRQYEGRHVYLNHDHGRKERRAEDKIGWFENVRMRANGTPEGDFHVLKSHPMAGAVLEAARRNPGLFGFSHVADCKVTRGANGRQTVEAVERVVSIDLVSVPATTKGLFEGVNAVAGTVKQLVEWACRNPAATTEQITRLRTLAEMDGMGDLAMDAPAEGADPDQAIDDAFKTAMHAQIDALIDGSHTVEELVKKIKALGKAHGKVKGAGEEAPAEEPKEDKSESVRLRAENDRLVRESADLRVKLLAAEKGVTLTEEQREALTLLPDDAKRARLLESFAPARPERPAEKPVSEGRKVISSAELLGKTVSEGTAPDAKAFAASIRN